MTKNKTPQPKITTATTTTMNPSSSSSKTRNTFLEPLPKMKPTITKQKLQERILKPRPYPLFIAEKTALVMEEIYNSIMNTVSSQNNRNQKNRDLSTYEIYQQQSFGSTKERIVILGTGWGSAAFLKDIDTNMYDVTVISPRNFFLFTPM